MVGSSSLYSIKVIKTLLTPILKNSSVIYI